MYNFQSIVCISFPLGQYVSVLHPHQNRSDRTIMQSANQQVLMALKAFATVDREVRGRAVLLLPRGSQWVCPNGTGVYTDGLVSNKKHNTTVTFSRIGENSMKMKDSIWGEEVTAKSLLPFSPLPPLPATTLLTLADDGPSAPSPYWNVRAMMLCC